ncbi:MAG TPA: type II and III secretion system protein [Gammaproteobacteria bacterium]|nr:type II and III secretion system protein [Gammaproteobacteria bacterium]
MMGVFKPRRAADQGRYALMLALVCALAGACSSQPKIDQSAGHIAADKAVPPAADIPPPVTQAPALPPPKPETRLETYTVIVNQVPIKELLFALARDAKLNLDIYDDIEGTITINAVDQTLPQILERISRQTAIRYQIEGDHLTVSADKPYLYTYRIPYVNMSRDSIGQINLSTQIAAGGTGNIGSSGSSQAGNNNSTLSVLNNSSNDFWRTLFINIRSIIKDTAQVNSADLSSPNVSVNRESGLISVSATSKQHAEVQAFIDKVVNSAQRQVLIEATVAEIKLSKRFQAGIDWARIDSGGTRTQLGDGTSTSQNLLGFVLNPTNLRSTPGLVLGYRDARDGYDVTGTLRLLEEFGDVSVLSSPKLMVLNNQTSLLKVVDNRVYFTVDVTETTNQNTTRVTYETEIHTVPVGLVMSLIPYISDTDEIILNIRPTISRILQFVKDPNPTLGTANTESLIPEIQVREMESMLRLINGQVGVIGGLMQNSVDKQTDSVPVISKVPLLGEAFKSRDNQFEKTELVIFLRATIVREPSLEADLKSLQQFLPSADRK